MPVLILITTIQYTVYSCNSQICMLTDSLFLFVEIHVCVLFLLTWGCRFWRRTVIALAVLEQVGWKCTSVNVGVFPPLCKSSFIANDWFERESSGEPHCPCLQWGFNYDNQNRNHYSTFNFAEIQSCQKWTAFCVVLYCRLLMAVAKCTGKDL